MPKVTHTTQTYERLLQAISDKGLKITKPQVGADYTFEDAGFIIIAPSKTSYSNLNDSSVGIQLINGNNAFIMYGDAESSSENDILKSGLDLNADVLKLGHHGSSTSTTNAILNKINPAHAVI